jgi:hypothetical protein
LELDAFFAFKVDIDSAVIDARPGRTAHIIPSQENRMGNGMPKNGGHIDGSIKRRFLFFVFFWISSQY